MYGAPPFDEDKSMPDEDMVVNPFLLHYVLVMEIMILFLNKDSGLSGLTT
jgi:hypothetical protein